jgi:uncharacterized membrane protein
VTTLVAVAFPYESTASAAAEDVRRLALDVVVDPDALAVVSRDRAGAVQMTTRHGLGSGTRWGVFWALLFDALFGEQPPETRSRAVDDTFRRNLRDMVTPGSSALFLAVDGIVSEHTVRELTRLGGVLVTWGMTADVRLLVEGALDGMAANETGGRLWPGDDSPPIPRQAATPVTQPGEACGSV